MPLNYGFRHFSKPEKLSCLFPTKVKNNFTKARIGFSEQFFVSLNQKIVINFYSGSVALAISDESITETTKIIASIKAIPKNIPQ